VLAAVIRGAIAPLPAEELGRVDVPVLLLNKINSHQPTCHYRFICRLAHV
jgi:hypothetical protein